MEDAKVSGSLIADGCQIGKGAVIENSVIGLRTVIGENVTIRNSVVMGADYIDSKINPRAEAVPLGIGDNSVIEGSILDKNCRIGKNCRVVNDTGVENQGEEEAVQIRDGIPIVIKNAELPDGFQLS
jgi:glucose-1-phosphate adenylyltransferase